MSQALLDKRNKDWTLLGRGYCVAAGDSLPSALPAPSKFIRLAGTGGALDAYYFGIQVQQWSDILLAIRHR